MVSLCGGGPFGRGALPLDGRLPAGAPYAALAGIGVSRALAAIRLGDA